MITTICKLSYSSRTVPPIVQAVQGDTGRTVRFDVTDFTIPAGAEATYFIEKPSGEAVYNAATISGNSILCELTAQSLAEPGENKMQVRVILDDEIVTSFKVCLLVSTFWGIDAIESSTEMNIFDKAVEQATENFQTNAEQIVEEVIESIPADYTELTEEVDELNERIDNIEPFSEDAKVALLNCFAHVSWDGGSGQQYYDALESALYSGQYPQIRAVFDAGSNVIYAGTSVDALKQYLTVKYYDSDTSSGTIISSTGYSLSGNLITGQNTVIVSYNGYTTTFQVFAEYPYYYELPEATAFDGVDDGIVLNDLNLLDRDKDYSVIIDLVEDNFNFSTNRYTAFRMRSSASSANVMILHGFKDSGGGNVTAYQLQVFGTQLSITFTGIDIQSTRHVKGCISHIAGSGTVKLGLKIDNESQTSNGSYTFAVSSYGMTLGCGHLGTDTADKNNFFKGTINEFGILKYAMTEEEMSAYMGGV